MPHVGAAAGEDARDLGRGGGGGGRGRRGGGAPAPGPRRANARATWGGAAGWIPGSADEEVRRGAGTVVLLPQARDGGGRGGLPRAVPAGRVRDPGGGRARAAVGGRPQREARRGGPGVAGGRLTG